MRNYSKRTRRYAVGGIVPDPRGDEDEEYEEFKQGYKEEREKELPQYRHKSIDRKSDDTGEVDVDPDDYLVPEDRDA